MKHVASGGRKNAPVSTPTMPDRENLIYLYPIAWHVVFKTAVAQNRLLIATLVKALRQLDR